MNLPILRMIASSHKTPIVNRSEPWFIDSTPIRPFVAAGAPVGGFDDDRAVGWSASGVNDLVVMVAAFGAFHGGLLAGLFDEFQVPFNVFGHGALAVLDQNLVNLAVLNLHHVDERIDERECLDVVQ